MTTKMVAGDEKTLRFFCRRPVAGDEKTLRFFCRRPVAGDEKNPLEVLYG